MRGAANAQVGAWECYQAIPERVREDARKMNRWSLAVGFGGSLFWIGLCGIDAMLIPEMTWARTAWWVLVGLAMLVAMLAVVLAPWSERSSARAMRSDPQRQAHDWLH
jgi:hypothetical protein